jgi:hypothetical protein
MHPSGRKWGEFRQRVLSFGGPFYNAPCYFCRHPFERPELAEIQHHIAPDVRPDLAWSVSNMAVAHSGRHRCPSCSIACQAVAAANHAPRDDQGRPVPWTEEFIARKSAEARARLASPPKSGTGHAPYARAQQQPASAPQRHQDDRGRDWDEMARERDRQAAETPVKAPTAPETEPEPVPGSPEWYARYAPEWR